MPASMSAFAEALVGVQHPAIRRGAACETRGWWVPARVEHGVCGDKAIVRGIVLPASARAVVIEEGGLSGVSSRDEAMGLPASS